MIHKTCFVACKQKAAVPSCAFLHSGQHLCYSLSGKYNSCTCFMQSFINLASLCIWAAWFESHLVWNPEGRFSRNQAYIYVNRKSNVYLTCSVLFISAFRSSSSFVFSRRRLTLFFRWRSRPVMLVKSSSVSSDELDPSPSGLGCR